MQSSQKKFSSGFEMPRSSTTASVTVEMDEAFVPGAQLEEPLEVHRVAVLRMWLLCYGVESSSALKKPQLIERY